MSDFVVRPLESGTWDEFAGLVERHNGVFGGCWCTWFHTMSSEKERTYEANRSLKCGLVDEGRAHAALVYDGDDAVAWCQYGSPQELPNIYHRKQYEEELDILPDYRITCIFVDKRYRRRASERTRAWGKWHDDGMTRARLSTTVDATLLERARSVRSGVTDAVLVDEALAALLARHRAAEVDASYAAYDEHPLDEPDEWGDLASFRRAAAAS